MKKNDIPEYIAWKGMKSRCYAPCNVNIGTYQKNKITICDEWIHDFELFFNEMGARPSKNHSLDRIDNNKGYSKQNCRWTTHDNQVKNRGDFNKKFTYMNETLVLKDWAKKFKIKYTTLWLRIFRNGLSFEKAIKKDAYDRLVQINDEFLTVKEWCVKFNIHPPNVYSRIHRGMSPADAILKPFVIKRG